MTVDTALSVALDVLFFSLFGVTLLDYLRRRDPVRGVVVLVFASLAVVLAVAMLRPQVPSAGPALGLLSLGALLAQPVLVFWLVSFVRPVPRAVLLLVVAGFAGLVVLLPAMTGAGGVTGGPGGAGLVLVLIAYFGVLEGWAAIAFALAARERAGSSRSRLATAAGATALLGLALVILLAASLVAGPGSAGAGVASLVARVLALFSALGYLVAFAPPPALRRLTQQSIVYRYIRDLNALSTGTPVETIWRLLEATAERTSGAFRVAVVLDGAGAAPPDGVRRIRIPFQSQRWPTSALELETRTHGLFVDDDLELISLLVDRGVRAAEREHFIAEREQLIDELQSASAAKSDFLAAMSHELRTPLNAIIGFSELLSEDDGEPADAATVRAYAEHIHASGLHLLELVNDVLDLARVEAGRLDLKPSEFELDALVGATIAAMRPLVDQKRQTIVVDLEPVAVVADAARVRQVILNLLSNAIKFTGEGGEIRVALRTGAAGQAELVVSDTGRGIAPSDLERIFEAFQQGDDRGTTSHHEGTGLGLALTRQLVDAHGGEISVRSEVGVGSAFTVRLPVEHAAVPVDRPTQVPDGRPTVVAIEDDPAARELLRVHLEGAGYALVAASSGRQGLSWVRQLRPDAVLVDILLPDIDGWEVLQQLKADPVTRSIPVMVVSVVDDRELGLALGAVDYIVKPVSREPLIEALGRLTFTTKVRTRNVKVLVIDADAEATTGYRSSLEPDGFQVVTASDGESGRRRAMEDRPDLILLDASLPDVDGFELAASLRRDATTASIPVWITTSAELPPEARARLNGNVQGVLERGERALQALHQWLAAGQSRVRAPEHSDGP